MNINLDNQVLAVLDTVETLAEIGELELLERLKPFCDRTIGDDGALVNIAPDCRLVVTTDVLADDVHFSDRTTLPHAIGWRSTAANLSDLAAMGATPLGITIGLGLPAQTTWPWIQQLYRGIADCLAQYGGTILGGDVYRANQRTVSITALGQVRPEHAIFRHTAKPGMTVITTGRHGFSRAGLDILLASKDIITDRQKSWVEKHQYPSPRLDAIAHLQSIRPYPTATGMDSSDGLANALLQISQRSGVGIEIEQSHLDISEDLIAFIGEEKALEWTLYGGEDFELVLCLSSVNADRFLSACKGAVAIGRTTRSSSVQLRLSNGSTQTLQYQGFQHF